MAFTGLQGKKLKLGINQEESFYQGDVLVRNNVKYWLDADGKNSTGDDLTEKVKESLEKHPIKKLRNQPATSASTTTTGTTAADVASGW